MGTFELAFLVLTPGLECLEVLLDHPAPTMETTLQNRGSAISTSAALFLSRYSISFALTG
jgi:hypothetical protein